MPNQDALKKTISLRELVEVARVSRNLRYCLLTTGYSESPLP